MAEKKMVQEQSAFIEKTRAARGRCAELAAAADKVELPLLAREWDFIGKCLDRAIAAQLRAFRDGVSEPSATVSPDAAPAGPQTVKTNQQLKLEPQS